MRALAGLGHTELEKEDVRAYRQAPVAGDRGVSGDR